MVCHRCGSHEDVRLEESRTAYPSPAYTLWIALMWDDTPPDPNAPIPLCRECALDHHEHWDDMWGQYYADRL